MTTTERKRMLSVEIVEHDYFVSQQCRWGYADKSESALFWSGRPVMIDGSKVYAAQLAAYVRELLENEYFGELPDYGAIVDDMENLVGRPATFDILKCVSGRWEQIRREEAIDRAKAWVSKHKNLIDEIDRIQPDAMYGYFHKAMDLDDTKNAILVYGYELGLAAARKGARG